MSVGVGLVSTILEALAATSLAPILLMLPLDEEIVESFANALPGVVSLHERPALCAQALSKVPVSEESLDAFRQLGTVRRVQPPISARPPPPRQWNGDD